MFIKNQQFSDEDTLLEMLFDFGLGDASPFMQEVVAGVNKKIESDIELTNHLRTLDEEDAMELITDIQLEQQARKLQEHFTSFSVYKAGLYGVKDTGEEVLLYQVDLY
jgi:hypothetical protein